MERHVIRESDIARFGAHLRGEEREAGTIEKYRRDVVQLADVLGHSSVETTRIYLISSGAEHARRMERLGLVFPE